MKAGDYGQGPCYKCGSKARVRTVRRFVLRGLYGIHCTNPDCGEATSRNYLRVENAVKAWNRKPTVGDLFVDRMFGKLESFLEKKPEKERED